MDQSHSNLPCPNCGHEEYVNFKFFGSKPLINRFPALSSFRTNLSERRRECFSFSFAPSVTILSLIPHCRRKVDLIYDLITAFCLFAFYRYERLMSHSLAKGEEYVR